MKTWFEKGELVWHKYVCNEMTRKPQDGNWDIDIHVPKEKPGFEKHYRTWYALSSFIGGFWSMSLKEKVEWEEDSTTIKDIQKQYCNNKLRPDELKLINNDNNIKEFLQNFDMYKQLGYFLDRVDKGGPFTDEDYKNINGDWNKLRLFTSCYTINKYKNPDFKSFLKSFIQQMGSDVNLNWISTYHITDMSNLFSGLYYFNGDISQWNVSKVTNMEGMFKGCAEFNCDISKWNVEKVMNMDEMFSGCLAFDHSLKGWKIGDNTSTKNMFRLCGIDDDNKPLLIK